MKLSLYHTLPGVLGTCLALGSIAAPVSAAELTQVSINCKAKVIEGCGPTECFTSANAKMQYHFEADLTPSEAAAFTGNTIININIPIIQASVDFDFDNGFNPGDTSIAYETTLNEIDGIPVVQKASASWANNKLVIDILTTAKGKTTGPAETLKALGIRPKACGEKAGGVPTVTFEISAENSGMEFFSMTGKLIANALAAQGEGVTTNGAGTTTTELRFKSKDFVNLNP